jgi:uncharacterized damage-inducible protein DinB
MKRLSAAVLFTLGAAACAPAPAPPAPEAVPSQPSRAVTDSIQVSYGVARTNLTQAAAQVPENLYAFQPTPDVRTLGQILAHVADSTYTICGAAGTEAPPDGSVEQTKTTKADIQQALADAFAYCDRVFAAMDDTIGAEPVSLFGLDLTKLGALSFTTSHQFEHYGNVVTYMRMNKMVPPSSQPAPGS